MKFEGYGADRNPIPHHRRQRNQGRQCGIPMPRTADESSDVSLHEIVDMVKKELTEISLRETFRQSEYAVKKVRRGFGLFSKA